MAKTKKVARAKKLARGKKLEKKVTLTIIGGESSGGGHEKWMS